MRLLQTLGHHSAHHHCDDSAGNRGAVVKAGAVDAIVEAMGIHGDNAGVQQVGCKSVMVFPYT